MSDNFEFKISPPEEREAKGGSELIYNRVLDLLDDDIKDEKSFEEYFGESIGELMPWARENENYSSSPSIS